MASINYNKMVHALATGAIDFDTDAFKMMLVTSTYTPDKDAHEFRDDVTNEVSGTGYTAGGAAVTLNVTRVDANDRTEIDFDDVTWSAATITARGAVIYKSRGGASSADELVGYIDFGEDKVSSGGDFVVTNTTPLYLSN